MFNPENILSLLQKNKTNTFWIAYSGGLDSHVLLQCVAHLKTYFPKSTFKAIHINHGLSPNAQQWENHCEQVCHDLAITYHSLKVDAQTKNGKGPEAVARQARYHAFAELMQEGDCLLTAHHQDDQAETVLLQLFRGSGPKGLAAMPQQISFAKGIHLRPLLYFSRNDLENYAKQNNLQWIDDESNFDTSFDRNFVRHELMPLIQHRWPSITEILSRSAKHHAEADALLSCLAANDFANTQGVKPATLSIRKLQQLDDARQRNLLRYTIQHFGFKPPLQTHLKHIQQDMLLAEQDANPQVSFGDIVVRRFRDELYFLKPRTYELSHINLEWDMQSPLTLPDGLGTLKLQSIQGQGIAAHKLQQVTVHFRQSGERFHSAGRMGSHPLKKLFQEWNVPTWERDSIPLVYVGDELVCVVGYAIAKAFAAGKDEQGYIFHMAQ